MIRTLICIFLFLPIDRRWRMSIWEINFFSLDIKDCHSGGGGGIKKQFETTHSPEIIKCKIKAQQEAIKKHCHSMMYEKRNARISSPRDIGGVRGRRRRRPGRSLLGFYWHTHASVGSPPCTFAMSSSSPSIRWPGYNLGPNKEEERNEGAAEEERAGRR